MRLICARSTLFDVKYGLSNLDAHKRNHYMQPSGYSGTPLVKKLGIKSNFRIRLINQPANYTDFFKCFPEDVVLLKNRTSAVDFIHYFENDSEALYKRLPVLKMQLSQNGMLWVSWPKKASNVKTDMTEDTIRDFALQIGLVDIKVCSVNEVWSALKLVIPVKNRTK